MTEFLVQLVLCLTALFIILLVLVQRGRGGGLAGALGGPGGSSAFGAKAGDVFTKITIWSASIWIVLCVLSTIWANNRGDAFGNRGSSVLPGTGTEINEEVEQGMGAPPEAEGQAAGSDDTPAEDTPAEDSGLVAEDQEESAE